MQMRPNPLFGVQLPIFALISALAGGGGRTSQGGTPCTSNEECLAGEMCVGGACTPGADTACQRASDCVAPMMCMAGRCQLPGGVDGGTGCTKDSQCTGGRTCQ